VATLERLAIAGRDPSVPVAYFHDELACLDDFAGEPQSKPRGSAPKPGHARVAPD
jgi:hypothetical protein